MHSHNDALSPSSRPPDPAARPDRPWDPDAVQALISDAYRRGETPVVLCVGRREAAALKVYLSKFFDDDVFYLKNLVYAGLKIVELRVDSHLRVETLRSRYHSSLHAEQLNIRRAMEQNRIDGSLPIRGTRVPPKPRTP